jgi:hypothetical protein
MTRDLLLQGIAAGVFATIVMDLAFIAGKVTGRIGAPFPLPVGRWAAHAVRGRVLHQTILESPAVRGEGPLTLVAHYLIGATLGTLFLLLMPPAPAAATFLGAVAFGTGTSLLPWLVMFPAMGYGPFGSRGPASAHMLRTSLYTHVAFGVGLGLWVTWIRPIL